MIQTANGDESSTGDDWLSVEAIVPVRVLVGIDEEQESPPRWLTSNFEKEPLTASIDEGAKLVFYSRTVDAGSFTLGGNTDNGDAGSMVNYTIAVTPLPLERNESKATMKAALAMLDAAIDIEARSVSALIGRRLRQMSHLNRSSLYRVRRVRDGAGTGSLRSTSG